MRTVRVYATPNAALLATRVVRVLLGAHVHQDLLLLLRRDAEQPELGRAHVHECTYIVIQFFVALIDHALTALQRVATRVVAVELTATRVVERWPATARSHHAVRHVHVERVALSLLQ